MTIKVKKVSPTAVIPTHGSSFAAGYDLYADIPEALIIRPHTTVTVDTGLKFELPEGTFAGILPVAASRPGKGSGRPIVSVYAIRITAAIIWLRCTTTRMNPGRCCRMRRSRR